MDTREPPLGASRKARWDAVHARMLDR